jgi:hypothetical protein
VPPFKQYGFFLCFSKEVKMENTKLQQSTLWVLKMHENRNLKLRKDGPISNEKAKFSTPAV